MILSLTSLLYIIIYNFFLIVISRFSIFTSSELLKYLVSPILEKFMKNLSKFWTTIILGKL